MGKTEIGVRMSWDRLASKAESLAAVAEARRALGRAWVPFARSEEEVPYRDLVLAARERAELENEALRAPETPLSD